MARKHSVVFVISDFLASDYFDEFRALAARHDLNAVNVLDTQTQLAASSELVHMEDTETGSQRYVDLKCKNRESDEHPIALQEQMLQSGIGLMELGVDEDCVAALASYFQSRHRRVADETGG